MTKTNELRNALRMAHSLLDHIEHGGSHTSRDWDNAMAVIETALDKPTVRATSYQHNRANGQSA